MKKKSKNTIKEHRHILININSDDEYCENIHECYICRRYFDKIDDKKPIFQEVYLEFSNEDGRIIRIIPIWMIEKGIMQK